MPDVPHEKLKVLAKISGGAAFLMLLALVFSGSFPGLPNNFKLALDEVSGTNLAGATYLAGTHSYVVPAGVTSLDVELWGAGGNIGNDQTTGSCSGYTVGLVGGEYAGGGGYAGATVPVTPGETLTLVVGAVNGGGIKGGNSAGAGGGYSGIFRGTATQANALIIAGGGGGSAGFPCVGGPAGTCGYTYTCSGGGPQSSNLQGGGGGGTAGESTADGAGGGTQTAGGARVVEPGSSAQNGSALTGGGADDAHGGGGGAGYWGGAGGPSYGTQRGGGGAGGSGYCASGNTGCSIMTASGSAAANSADPDRPSVGTGVYAGDEAANGALVLTPSYPTVTTSVTDSSAGEPSNDGVIRISRDSGSGTLDINFNTTGSTGTRGTCGTTGVDYRLTASNGSILGSNDQSVEITTGNYVDVTIDVCDDTTVESTETAVINVVSGSNYTGTPSSSVNITDEDSSLPTISLSTPDSSAGEPSNNGTIRVSRDSGSGTLTVNFNSNSSTGTRGSSCSGSADYYLSASNSSISGSSDTSLTISSGNYTDVTVTVCDDTTVESTESAYLNVTSSSNYSGTPSASIDITDDDVALPVITLSKPDASAGEPSNNGTIRVSRDSGSGTLTVNFNSNSSTGTRGSSCSGSADYYLSASNSSISGSSDTSLTISSGNYTDVTVTVCDDTTVESTESAYLNVTSSSNYSGTPSTFMNITDDEVATPTITISVTDSTLGEPSNDGVMRVERSGGSGTATIDFSTSGTATRGSSCTAGVDYYLAASDSSISGASDTTMTISTGNYTDVVAVACDDSTLEGSEDMMVTLLSASGYTGLPTFASVALTDDDNLSLSANPTTVNSGSASTLTLTTQNVATGGGGGSPVTQIITTGTSWTVPADWNSSDNSVEVIGGGGAGHSSSYGGGGGGAYSKITNLSLTPNSSVPYVIGGQSGDTYFNGANCAASSVCAKGGSSSTGSSGASGGQATGGVGATKYNGGNGGNSYFGFISGGGGGAGGPGGAGGNGGNGSSGGPGAGGAGGGGAGGAGGTFSSPDGGDGTEWSTAGSGGGGGGDYSESAGDGGNYGGGGGGGTGSSGGQGVLVITYTPTGGGSGNPCSLTGPSGELWSGGAVTDISTSSGALTSNSTFTLECDMASPPTPQSVQTAVTVNPVDVCNDIDGDQPTPPTGCQTPNPSPGVCIPTGYIWDENDTECVLVPPPSGILLEASRVRRGNPSTLSWVVTGMAEGVACYITPALSGYPANGLLTWPDPFLNPWSSSAQSNAITASTMFTLSCGNGTASTSVSATAGILPAFREI